MDPARILYEDNHLIAVNKLPGEISQGDKTGDIPIGELVSEYLKVKYQKPGNVSGVCCIVWTGQQVVYCCLQNRQGSRTNEQDHRRA